MKKNILFIALAFAIFFTAKSFSFSSLKYGNNKEITLCKVSGKVVSDDRLTTEVFITSFSGKVTQPIKKSEIGQASFNFNELPVDYYTLWISSKDTKPISIPILLKNPENLNLLIKIESNANVLTLLSIEVLEGLSIHKEIFDIKNVIDKELGDYSTKFKKHFKELSFTEFKYPYKNLISSLLSLIDSKDIASQYAAALLIVNSDKLKQIIALDMKNRSKISSLLTTALYKIPPNSSFWEMVVGDAPLCRMASGLLNNNDAEELFDSIYKGNSNQDVRDSALLELTKLAFVYGGLETFEKRYNKLNKNRSQLSSFIKTELYMMKPSSDKLTVGSSVPSFELKLINQSTTISNKDMLGKYYLIDFWGTWCPPCLEEMPFLHEANKQFFNRNFEIISIAWGDKIENLNRFHKKWPMPWKNIVVESLKDNIAFIFDLWHAPTAYLISPTGKIIAAEFMLRGNNLLETLERVLPKK